MNKLFYVVLGGLLVAPSLALAQTARVQGPKLPELKMDSVKTQVSSLEEYIQKQDKKVRIYDDQNPKPYVLENLREYPLSEMAEREGPISLVSPKYTKEGLVFTDGKSVVEKRNFPDDPLVYQLANTYPQQEKEILAVATAYYYLHRAVVSNDKKALPSLQEELLGSYAALAQQNKKAAAEAKARLRPKIKMLSKENAVQLNALSRLMSEEEEPVMLPNERPLSMYILQNPEEHPLSMYIVQDPEEPGHERM